MLIMHTLQSLAFLIVLLATAFLGARLMMDGQTRHLARSGAPDPVSLENLLGAPEPEAGRYTPLPPLRSAPARNDEPYDQMKDLAR